MLLIFIYVCECVFVFVCVCIYVCVKLIFHLDIGLYILHWNITNL